MIGNGKAIWRAYNHEDGGVSMQIELGKDRAVVLTIRPGEGPNVSLWRFNGEHDFADHTTPASFRAWLDDLMFGVAPSPSEDGSGLTAAERNWIEAPYGISAEKLMSRGATRIRRTRGARTLPGRRGTPDRSSGAADATRSGAKTVSEQNDLFRARKARHARWETSFGEGIRAAIDADVARYGVEEVRRGIAAVDAMIERMYPKPGNPETSISARPPGVEPNDPG